MIDKQEAAIFKSKQDLIEMLYFDSREQKLA